MEEHDIKVERDIIFRELVEVVIAVEADKNEQSNDIYQGEQLEFVETEENIEEPEVLVEDTHNPREEEEPHIEEEEKEEVTEKEVEEDEGEGDLEREEKRKKAKYELERESQA